MSEEQINDLSCIVARMEGRMEGMRERDEEHSAKLEKMFGLLLQANSEREADFFTLKLSIKRKITESFTELKKYHDADVKALENDIKVAAWLGRNKKLIFIACFALLFACYEQVLDIVAHYTKEQGLELPKPEINTQKTYGKIRTTD